MAQPAKNPKSNKVQTLLTDADYSALENYAAMSRVSVSEAARAAILEKLLAHPHCYSGPVLPGQMQLFGEGTET